MATHKKKNNDKLLLSPRNLPFINDIGTTSIFHYTSLDALLGIIEKNTLRLSSFLELNDPDEGKYGASVLCKYGSESYLDCRKDSRIPVENMFSLSLSKLVDDISNWERYGKDSKGVCIEFNREKLQDFCNISLNTYPIVIQDVFYGERAIIESLQELEKTEIVEILEMQLLNCKRLGWRQEHEVRVSTILVDDDASKVQTIYEGGKLKRFVSLTDITSHSKQINIIELIESITLGPKISTEYEKSKLLDLLSNRKIVIEESKIRLSEINI